MAASPFRERNLYPDAAVWLVDARIELRLHRRISEAPVQAQLKGLAYLPS